MRSAIKAVACAGSQPSFREKNCPKIVPKTKNSIKVSLIWKIIIFPFDFLRGDFFFLALCVCVCVSVCVFRASWASCVSVCVEKEIQKIFLKKKQSVTCVRSHCNRDCE